MGTLVVVVAIEEEKVTKRHLFRGAPVMSRHGRGNKKPRGFMQSCFPFLCILNGVVFLLYFYKCSTSMAFT